MVVDFESNKKADQLPHPSVAGRVTALWTHSKEAH